MLFIDLNATSASAIGTLPIGFTQRWRLATFAEGTKGAESLQSVTWLQSMDQQAIITRWLCQFYVRYMPTRGLDELSETLRDMYEFYQELPEPEQIPLAQATTVKAKVTATIMRPDFCIDDTE